MDILGRKSALSRQLEQAYARMAALDPQRDGAAMYRQLSDAQPELSEKLARMAQARPDLPGLLEALQQSFGAKLVTRIKELPFFVNELIARVNNAHTKPALRCAITSALAFLAQPDDITHDTDDAGYGFVDDAAMIDAALLLMLQPSEDPGSTLLTAIQESMDATVNFLPAASRGPMRSAIQDLSDLMSAMSMVTDEVANAATLQLLDNPGLATAPPPARRVSPLPGAVPQGPRKILTDGPNLYVPGGPALVQGEVVVPD